MFYIISTNTLDATKRLIDACEKRNINYQLLNPLTFDLNKNNFSDKDSFYRVSRIKRARLLDDYLVDKGCVTVKKQESKKNFSRLNTIEQNELCEKQGIKCIPTIYFPVLNQNILLKQVENLNGFPVIVKEMGSSNGGGVMKIDSISSLLSILNIVLHSARGDVVLKKYIEHDEQARIVVLNGVVVGEKANLRNSDDVIIGGAGTRFISEKKEYPKEIREMAIKAVEALGLNFGGVDILIGKDGKNYLAEVNMPCAFTYVEDVAGIDIAGKIVEFLK